MTREPAKVEIEGLATDYAAGQWIAAHAHDRHQIIHASAGVLRVVSDTDSWIVPPGRAIWMPARRSHSIHCRTEVQMRTVYIRGAVSGLPEVCAVWTVSPLMREVLIRLAGSPVPEGRDHLVALLLLEIETSSARPFHLPLPADPRLRRLADALCTEPSTSTPLRDWAPRLGLSERNLIRRFRAETGMTFRQWRRQVRVLAALEQLAAGSPVTTVAFAVGYESVSAFVAAFHDTFGEPPGRYLRSGASR